MRVALVHDWLTGMRGGERVLEAYLDIYPDAEIFTLLHVPGSVSRRIESRPIHTSFVDRLPGAHRQGRVYLPLFPLAIEAFDLRGFDLVVSLSHCVAKGVLVPSRAMHFCYCFSPMRYAWDQHAIYREAVRPALARPLWSLLMAGLRVWDVSSAGRPDRYFANSGHTARRIQRFYRREAEVLHSPIDLDALPLARRPPGDYYLVLSALVPYKRVELAVAAAARLPYPVWIAGTGPERARLEAMASDRVRFLGWVGDAERAELLAGCRALLFPGEEDFGLVPIECNATGRPVVGWGVGGLVETQVEGETAVYMREQSVDGLVEAVARAESIRWEPARVRAQAERFSPAAFRQAWEAALRDAGA